MPRKLRVVESGEEKPRVLSVAEAAALNDHRELLVALRARIAQSIQAPNVPAVALAALSRQLVLISKEMAVLDAAGGEDDLYLWLHVLLMRLGTARFRPLFLDHGRALPARSRHPLSTMPDPVFRKFERMSVCLLKSRRVG